jgi:hypothetical protein
VNDLLTRLWRPGKPLQWRFRWLALPARSLLSAPDGLGYPELAATPGGTGGRPGAGTWQVQRADGSDPLTLRPLGRRQMISGWGASGQQHELPVGASAEAR